MFTAVLFIEGKNGKEPYVGFIITIMAHPCDGILCSLQECAQQSQANTGENQSAE